MGGARWALAALAALLAAASAALRPRCPPAPAHCAEGGGGQNEYNYYVDNVTLLIEYADGGHYKLTCEGGVTLDSPSLPRFASARPVPHVMVARCPAPASSYRASLRALGVEPARRLSVLGPLRLRAEQLAGLPRLTALMLADVALAEDALEPLANLTDLVLIRSPPPARLPASLVTLEVRAGGAPRALHSLPNLAELLVREGRPLRLDASRAPALRKLTVESDGTDVGASLPPQLTTLTLYQWAPERVTPWAACAELVHLTVLGGDEVTLPSHWVSRCRKLRSLELKYFNGTLLHESALAGANELRNLTIKQCGLTSLPSGFLNDLINLEILDLSLNKLIDLPSAMFVGPGALHTLNLSGNWLPGEALARVSGERLQRSLTALHLDRNPLGNTCGGAGNTVRGMSPLQLLTELRVLSLAGTGASLMCLDWRTLMPHLAKLDLQNNNFTALEYDDVMAAGPDELVVLLQDNPVRRLSYTRCNYVEALEGARSRLRLALSAELRCDCGAYWAARALRTASEHLRVSGARCGAELGGAELSEVPLARLQCDVNASDAARRGLPAACRAAWQPRARSQRAQGCLSVPGAGPGTGAGAEPGRLWRVSCAGAALRSVPRLAADNPDIAWELSLPNNSIATLTPDDLNRTNLVALDLRNNSISSLDLATLQAAAGRERLLSLAHNPFDCSCGASGALGALHAHRQLLDYDALACAGAGPGSLSAARDDSAVRCAPRAGLWAGRALLVLLALLAAAAGAVALHARSRARFKRILVRAGWLAPRQPPRRWDAFVSYSSRDEAAARALVSALESRAYRVCEHGRDWAPGGQIAAQVLASVHSSRVTLALLSEHFLRSQWACEEFRAALRESAATGTARLVAVLLREPAELALDEALRRYLAANTYLLWGEPHFWDKLRRALGPPAAVPPPPRPRPVTSPVASPIASPVASPDTTVVTPVVAPPPETDGSARTTARSVPATDSGVSSDSAESRHTDAEATAADEYPMDTLNLRADEHSLARLERTQQLCISVH